MAFHQNKSVTLLELIIAISLVAVIILGINSISIFSRNQVISSDRRAKLQNDISYSLDHITKQGLKTIGNEVIYGTNSAVLVEDVLPDTSLAFFIDGNSNGQRDIPNDYWIKYTFNSVNHQLSYCNNCGSSSAPGFCSGGTEVLSEKITVFTPTKVANFAEGNHVGVQVSERWDPSISSSTDNPEMAMHATIQLPSVSTN